MLFVGGALSAIPSLLLLDKPLDAWAYVFTGFGLAAGAACWWSSRYGVGERWLAVIPLLAVPEIVVAVSAMDYVFNYLYFLIALYVALVFSSFRRMAPFLVLIVLGLLAPFAFTSESVQTTALWLLVVGPPVSSPRSSSAGSRATSRRVARPTVSSPGWTG